MPRLRRCRLLILALLLSPPLAARGDKPQQEKGKRQPTPTDAYGDPLPSGALLRLGTTRLCHQAAVTAVAFSPDGKVLASGSEDGTARLWAMPGGKEVHQLGVLGDPAVRTLTFSRDGKVLAFAGDDSRINLWRVATGKRLHLLKGKPEGIRALAYAPDGKTLVSGHQDGSIQFWDAARGRKLWSLEGHKGRVNALAFSADGKTLASGGRDETVRLWDPATGKTIRTIRGQTSTIYCLAFSPRGRALAVGGGPDWTVRLLDPATGKELHRLFGPGDDIESIAFSPDGKTLASAAGDGEILVWDVATGQGVRRLVEEGGYVHAVAFSPDGLTVAGGTSGRRVRLWEAATGKKIRSLAEHQQPLESVACSANNKWLATRGRDGMILLWDPATGKRVRAIIGREGDGDPIPAPVAFAPDSRTLVSVDKARWLCRWDVATGKEKARLKKFSSYARSVTWSADARALASASRIDGVQLWDLVKGNEFELVASRFRGPFAQFLAFSPDGKTLCVASAERVQLWDTASGDYLRQLDIGDGLPLRGRGRGRRFRGPTNLPVCAAFAPDGKALAAAGLSGVYLWDLAAGRERLHISEQAAEFLVFSPDGKTLAAADRDQTIRVWETATGYERCCFRGHQGEVKWLAFSPDGRRLASASADTTALVWDVTGLVRAGRLPALPLSSRELESLWTDLGKGDGPPAHRAIWKLVAGQKQTLPFLQQRTGPVTADAERLARLIADLDDRQYKTRQRAFRELEGLEEVVESALRKALRQKPSLEVQQRLQRLLARLKELEKLSLSPSRLRALRTVEVLEHIGTPEARRRLKQLASGAREARLTREAKAALKRLADRP
jgi:WD40 repeat protein